MTKNKRKWMKILIFTLYPPIQALLEKISEKNEEIGI